MTHGLSSSDQRFREDFEAGRIRAADFDHRAHVRLAYCHLVDTDCDAALASMRDALQRFIRLNGVPESKYHETLTRAWILAVQHFMSSSTPAASAEEFIAANPRLLDAKIMMSHYSAEVLFSPEARARFVEPDLEEIPGHRAG